MAKEVLVITGVHRSGTTWLGRVVQKTGEVALLHEPFNKASGLQGIPYWYCYHPGKYEKVGQHELVVEQLVDAYFRGTARFVWRRKNDRELKNFFRRFIGSREERYSRKVFRSRNGKILLKDPFCLLLSELLISKYDSKIVILVRHPAAHFVSMQRMGWTAPLVDLSAQKCFRKRYGFDIDWESTCSEGSKLQLNSFFWLVSHRYVLDLKVRFPSSVLIVRHEDLSINPVGEIERLKSFFGLSDKDGQAVSYALQSTNQATVVPSPGVLHDFSRDGRRLVAHWRERLSESEVSEIKAIVAPVADQLYPDLSWSDTR